MVKYNHRQGIKVSKFNGHLEKFRNIHEGKEGMILIAAPSFLDRWKGKPDIPEYDTCIKGTMNRMISSNPIVAKDADYYFFGSWYNRDMEYQKQVNQFLSESNCTKFGSAYENGWSHKDIARGNVYPDQCKELGVNPFENNDAHWSNDISKFCLFGFSIIFPVVQIFLYMGFDVIYLVGADCGYTLENEPAFDAALVSIWGSFKNWYQNEEKYKHVKIVSINPVALKGMFDDRFTD